TGQSENRMLFHSTSRFLIPYSSRFNILKCKYLVLQTLHQPNKNFSTLYFFHPSVQIDKVFHDLPDILLYKHLPSKIGFKRRVASLYSTSTVSEDHKIEDDKPSARTPIRKERMEGQELLRMTLSQKSELTAEDWTQLGEKLTANVKENWQVLCMHTIYIDGNLNAGKSLISYLNQQNIELSPIILTFYIGLLGKTANHSEDQEKEMMHYFNVLKSKLDVFDAASIEVLVSGISKTRYYLECLPLLKLYQEFNSLSQSLLCDLLEAGLKYMNDEVIKMAFSEFNFGDAEVLNITLRVPKMVQTCLVSGNEKGFEMLMDFLRQHRLNLPKSGLDNIVEHFQSYQPDKWRMQFGQSHPKRGTCNVCHTQLKEIEITESEFSAVRKAFLSQVIIGKNVFYKSNPLEVKNFIHFVKVRGPFDIVVDGLNVLYKGHGPPSKSKLQPVLSYLMRQNQRVLLLGNKVLMKCLPKITNPELFHVFLTETTKADDVFYLYAALHSGIDCLILTSDKLRDHRFLMQKDLRPIFNKWIQKVQIHHWFNDTTTFAVLRRDVFDLGPVKDDGGWHLPVNEVDKNFPFGKNSLLCLRHKDWKQASSPDPVLPHSSIKAHDHRSPGQKTDNLKQMDKDFQESLDQLRHFYKEMNVKKDKVDNRKRVDNVEWFKM
ncbi:mitochondrial ribonuclease P protein 3, partial [Biomphalaria glabrata]